MWSISQKTNLKKTKFVFSEPTADKNIARGELFWNSLVRFLILFRKYKIDLRWNWDWNYPFSKIESESFTWLFVIFPL